jgi:putative flavoprotein involved in K+ transport
VHDLPSPRGRLACNPQLSGHGGGHDVSLRAMSSEGLRLFGRLEAIEGTRARFATDLQDKLEFADTFFARQFRDDCDTFVARTGIDLPEDEPATFTFEPSTAPELDLAAEGFSTVLWTSGYRPAFNWIRLPVLDEFGLPITDGGLTSVPGQAFLGTPWMVDMGSANLVGLERDAKALAARWD